MSTTTTGGPYTARTSLTVTNLVSLASVSGWQSDFIDIAANGWLDVAFWFSILGAASNAKTIDFFAACALGDTNFDDGATGTEATFTAANRVTSPLLRALLLNGATTVKGSVRLSRLFATMPSRVALIGVNNCAQAIGATVSIYYEGYKQTNG